MRVKVNLPNQSTYKQIDNRWSELKLQNAFAPRQAFAFCAQGNIGYVHGGYNCDQGILSDMYMAKFNDSQDRHWYKIQQKGKCLPGKLRYHTLTSYLCYLICAGGQKSQTQNNGEIYCFNLKGEIWSKLNYVSEDQNTSLQQIKQLLKRDSHCSVVNAKYLYIFGGYLSQLGSYTNSTLRLNLTKIETGQISIKIINMDANNQIPAPRANFASCAFNGNMYIFGGTDSIQFYDDFWKFSFETEKWQNLTVGEDARLFWPEKRKGAVLVSYPQSKSLFLFGGMQTITKQKNDLSIYLTEKKQWVKVHSNTNNIYDPSPTIKQQYENSPTIINYNSKKSQKPDFRIGVITTSISQPPEKLVFRSRSIKDTKETTKSEFNRKVCLTQNANFHIHPSKSAVTDTNFYTKKQSANKMSVVQQKKHRQFLARKKRLLSQVYATFKQDKIRRPYSPTSQCLNYTLNQLGEQHQYFQSKNPQFQLPKVIFDDKKSQVIGKKPCARDGHAAFSFDKKMFIIGGDRHMISFNDTHLLRMDKAMQSISYYS